MITAAELAQIQRDVTAIALSLPCEIQRKTVTKDQFLTATESWVTISPAGLMCGMSQPTGTMLQNFDYLVGSHKTWMIHLPLDTDVAHQDKIIVEEKELTVQVILAPRSYAVLLTVLVGEIE